MKLIPQGHIEKDWGLEIIWSNNDHYCGKLLMFNGVGKQTAMMIHKNKKKSYFVNAGRFKITFIDVKTGNTKEALLDEGKTVDIAEMSPHRIESLLPDSIIIEVGTSAYEEDEFKLTPDADQTQSLGQ